MFCTPLPLPIGDSRGGDSIRRGTEYQPRTPRVLGEAGCGNRATSQWAMRAVVETQGGEPRRSETDGLDTQRAGVATQGRVRARVGVRGSLVLCEDGKGEGEGE